VRLNMCIGARCKMFRCLQRRWMAPECLASRRFSTYTDVWAFGVTAWELFADPPGAMPYARVNNFSLLAHLLQGKFHAPFTRLTRVRSNACPMNNATSMYDFLHGCQ
jgi:serine/threonine protein kinase